MKCASKIILWEKEPAPRAREVLIARRYICFFSHSVSRSGERLVVVCKKDAWRRASEGQNFSAKTMGVWRWCVRLLAAARSTFSVVWKETPPQTKIHLGQRHLSHLNCDSLQRYSSSIYFAPGPAPIDAPTSHLPSLQNIMWLLFSLHSSFPYQQQHIFSLVVQHRGHF